MQLKLLKPETQSKSPEFASALDKMQFRRVEVPSQEHYMVHPRFSYIIRTRKNYISFKSNNKLASKWRNNLKSKQHFHTNASWNYLILNMAVWWGSQGGEEAEAGREEALMSNICLISHHWYDVEKLTVPGSSTLPEIALLNFNSCFYNLSTRNSCFTTSLFTRFLFMVTEILRKVVLFCHHSKT